MEKEDDSENMGDQKGKKKPRRRMKALYGKIREQMEFYFSDANLHKDRFLKKAIEATQDGYIDLNTFLKFNKIRAITNDANVLADAISTTSSFLQLNDKKTHLRRTTPIQEPKNIDDRTVYVEHLPHSVNHDWVKRLFTSCGKVTYVSLPRYPSTGDLKGFAFVEFETIEGAQKACKELNNPPAESYSSSVGMFPKSSTQWEEIKKKLPEEQIEATKEKAKELVLSEKSENDPSKEPQPDKDRALPHVAPEPKSRRRRTTSEGSLEGAIASKRRKHDVSFDAQKNVEADKGSAKKKSRKRKSRSKTVDGVVSTGEASKTEDSELDTSSEVVPEKKQKLDKDQSGSSEECKTGKVEGKEAEGPTKGSQDSLKKKKKRSRRKKPRKEKEITEMRVIPKKEWLGLREEYLRLQKTSMTLLKKTLGEVKQQNTGEDVKEEKQQKKKGREIQFVPGVIVKVTAENPLSRKAVKSSLGEVDVAYVDVQDGLQEGHVRCHTSQDAANITAMSADGYTFSLVSGEEEKCYWDKLTADRDSKYSSKSRNKKRGHEKWTEKAEKASVDTMARTHITFEDD